MEWSTFWCNFYVFLPLHVRAFGLFVFLKLVILLLALPYLPVEQAEQVFTAAVCHSHRANNNAKHTLLCDRPHHYTRRELLSYDSNVTLRLHPQLCLWLKDLGIARNVPKKPRRSKRGGRRKRRKIYVIVGVHGPASLGPALPSPHLHSSLCSLEKPSASAISITPDEINSTASNTLLACGHTQKGNLIYIDAKKQDTRFSVCVFNAQSVGSRDKRTEIVKYICDECVDMFLTETWMRSHGDEAKYADLKPPGYS